MDRQSSFDIIFYHKSLGLTFSPEKDDIGAVVNGFYRLDDELLEGELTRSVALKDRIIAVQGKSVEKENFNSILTTLRSKKRPVKITFERIKGNGVLEISWNEVLSHSTDLTIYLNFLRRKGLYLCSQWLTFVINMERVLKGKGEERSTEIEKLWEDYVNPKGKLTDQMFYSPSTPPKKNMTISEKSYFLSNMKIEMRDRIIRLSWNGFVQSPEYQLLRLNMKNVLYNHHACNIFMAFLLCKVNYIELGLWMEIHYSLLPLIKKSQYPDCIDDMLEYIMIRPCFSEDDDEAANKNNILLECDSFLDLDGRLEAMALNYLTPSEPVSLMTSILSENDDGVSRRLSAASTNSSYDDHDIMVTVYSEEEIQQISSLFIRIYKQFFVNQKWDLFPDYFESILEIIYSQLQSQSYIDVTTMDLLTLLLCDIQVRLFHFIFNQYYSSFVVKDLFEYLVNDIRVPSTDHVNFSLLRKATNYTMDRIKDCEQEIPYLRGFIQQYSENTIGLLNMSDTDNMGDQTPAPLIEAAIDGNKTKSITSQEVVTSMTQKFKPISLVTLIDYIQKHRDFSIHQVYISNDITPRLSHLKKQSVFKAIFYKGNESMQCIEEIDSVMIEQFESTGMKPPVSPKSFFLPEGYASFGHPVNNRIFTFLLGGTSSERWSAACLNVYAPLNLNENIRYVPEGIIILSPFNNLAQLKEILKGFLIDDYPIFSQAEPEKKHQLLASLLTKSTISARRRFSAALMQSCEKKRHRKSRFLFINSDSDDCLSPPGSPIPLPPRVHEAKSPLLNLSITTNTPSTNSLQLLFQLLSLPHIFVLLRVLLLERSVLFLSTQYSLLTSTMDAVKELLRPFVWNYTYCPVLTKDMKVCINSPMPYMIGVNPQYISKNELERLKGITIINIDQDHLFLPTDLQDYYTLCPSLMSFEVSQGIPRKIELMKDSILPPLPKVNDIDLFVEVHILFPPFSYASFIQRRLLFTELDQCDNALFSPAVSFPTDSIKTLFRTYFSSMIFPPFDATTLMVEENKTIWILEKSKYLRQYSDQWSYQFMQRFIETSMFSVFYLNFFNWK